MADFARLRLACKAWGAAVHSKQPMAMYDLIGHEPVAEACGRHLARLTASTAKVHIRSAPRSGQLVAFFRASGHGAFPAVRTVILETDISAAEALLLGRSFPGLRELAGDYLLGVGLLAGGEAVEALRGIGATCPDLQVLEVRPRRLADLAGVSACTSLSRLLVADYMPDDGGSYEHDWGGAVDHMALGALAALSGLEQLGLQLHCPPPPLFQPLTGLSHLTSIRLDGSVSGGCLAVMGQIPALARLDVRGELEELEAGWWRLPHLTLLRFDHADGGGPLVNGAVVASRCPMLRSLDMRGDTVVREEDEDGPAGLRPCVRTLRMLEARGLLAYVCLRLDCSPAGLRVAWEAEMGSDAMFLSVGRLVLGPVRPAQEPAYSDCWGWLFSRMPRVRDLTCPEVAIVAAAGCLTELNFVIVYDGAEKAWWFISRAARARGLRVRVRSFRGHRAYWLCTP